MANIFKQFLLRTAPECYSPNNLPSSVDFMAIVDKRSKPALYASKMIADNAALLTLLNSVQLCEDKVYPDEKRNYNGILSAL